VTDDSLLLDGLLSLELRSFERLRRSQDDKFRMGILRRDTF